MAEPAGAALSGAKRDELRARLARLRREYSETASRLRRARRAERGGGGDARHERHERPAGPGEAPPPRAGGRQSCQPQPQSCPVPGTDGTTADPCQERPQFLTRKVNLPGTSQGSQEDARRESVRPAAEGKEAQATGGRMKLRKRRTKAVVPEEGQSLRDALLVTSEETVTSDVSGREELGSPVFRRSRFPSAEEGARGSSGAAPAGGAGSSSCAAGGSPELLGAPSVSRSDSLSPGTSHGARKEPSHAEKQVLSERTGEGPRELCSLRDCMSEEDVLPPDRNNALISESGSSEGNQNEANDFHCFPTDPLTGSGEELVETRELETESRLSHVEKPRTPEAENTMNSYTVVEGLLFPVEYYVRTTRRVSNCQRKVDLDAVILSQLGKSKKGLRSKCKQKDANLDQPSQETVENEEEAGVGPFPSLGAGSSPVNPGSPRPSLTPSNSSSTSRGSSSQSSVASTKRQHRQSHRKQKGRRKSTCKPAVSRAPPELAVGVGPAAPQEGTSVLANDCPSAKESPEGDPDKPSLRERSPPGAAAAACAGTGAPGTAEPVAAAAPRGAPGLSEAPLDQLPNPLRRSDAGDAGQDACGGGSAGEPGAPLHGGPRGLAGGGGRSRGARGAARIPDTGHGSSLRPAARRSAARAPKGESRRCDQGMDSEDPAAPALPAAAPDAADSLFSFRSLQRLPSMLGIQDFHLPDEEFGLLKLEKFKSSPVNDLEVFVPSVSGDGVASEETQGPQMNAEKKSPESNVISPFRNVLCRLPHLESPASKKGLCTSELLFTPTETLLAGAPTQPDSQISASLFPVLGATPAILPSDVLPDTPSVLPLPATVASDQAVDRGECRDSVLPPGPGSCGEESAGKEEEPRAVLHVEAAGDAERTSGGMLPSREPEQPEGRAPGCCGARGEQEETAAEQLAAVQPDGLREETLQLISKLKDSSRSCAVDVSSMWWEGAGRRELRVVTACETSVSLWKLLAPARWGKVCAWQPGEIPVIQIIPLPDTCNLVCVALGDLEIGEIRLLHYCSESDSFQQSLVKAGNIKAVLGLRGRRLASSSRAAQEQRVEITAFSEAGRSKEGQTLMPPEETVLAFAEVEEMRDALVGTTAVNSIVIWNLKTGQLLRKMHVGYSYPASICHRAYSDSGLLFVVLSHPHAKESAQCGNPAFRLVAFNPRTARSTGVVCSSLPPGHAGRYVEGEVAAAAAAVLSSGSIAVWEPRLGRCAALLPPAPGAAWALVRWAGTALLAARRDGTVHLYRYAPPHGTAAELP